MSVSTPIPRTARHGRFRPPVAIVAIVAVVVALAVWAIESFIAGSPSQTRPSAVTGASALRSLTPQQRQYVTAIASLSPATLAAAFGTDHASGVDAVLATLTPQQRRYVRAITSLSDRQLAAAFGFDPRLLSLSARQVMALAALQRAAEQAGLHPGVLGSAPHH